MSAVDCFICSTVFLVIAGSLAVEEHKYYGGVSLFGAAVLVFCFLLFGVSAFRVALCLSTLS